VGFPNIPSKPLRGPFEYPSKPHRTITPASRGHHGSNTAALRAFLRQDPYVILLGEVRDTETARIAPQAGRTGQFVMSTMHTNSALQAMSRLIDFGVKPLRRISLIDGKGVEVIDGLGAQYVAKYLLTTRVLVISF